MFGEFQPQSREEGDKRVDCGPPIKGYFPPVITEEQFLRAQAGMKARFRRLGRPGEFGTNLFTGIVRHAEDKTTMSVQTFRQAATKDGETKPYRYLTSGGTANGALRRGSGLSFPYPPFEQAVLQALPELTATDVLGAEQEGDDSDPRGFACRPFAQIVGRLRAAELDGLPPNLHLPLPV